MWKSKITAALCLTEITGMAGFATFPALVPTFQHEWGISNTQAGWISGIYYAGYMLLVPILASLTDRVDPRRILLVGAIFSGVSALAFGLWANGLWLALLFRFVAGMGLAGTFMPGLKLLSDHTEGSLQSRYIAFYTSSFSIGASTSYFMSGEIAAALGWRWCFGLAAVGSLVSAVIIVTLLPAGRPRSETESRMLLDFRPVFETKPAMAYILAYTAHAWELFSFRSWIVAFLAFSQSLQGWGTAWNLTLIAAIVNLLGLPASIGGNELAVAFGRRRAIRLIMVVSFLVSCAVGFSASSSAAIVVGLCLIYGVTVMADSASLTAGAISVAPPGHRGATLAVHSTLGFSAGFIGPLAVGAVLDLFGGARIAWGLAFVTMGLGSALGPIALRILGRSEMRALKHSSTQALEK
jgi:MFS family permease